ncbi:MAG: hypothetical protein J6T71_01680 [Paludibacteraceae bacterium]|nr:hypothetical protein [Paludibacteraceae bacterium]
MAIRFNIKKYEQVKAEGVRKEKERPGNGALFLCGKCLRKSTEFMDCIPKNNINFRIIFQKICTIQKKALNLQRIFMKYRE